MKATNESFPRNTLRQADLALQGWRDLINKLAVPNLSLEEFERIIAEATEQVDLAEKLKEERSQAVKIRNAKLKDLWDLTKRIRNAAKATFGDNSAEIEKFGGKSIRQRRRRFVEEEE